MAWFFGDGFDLYQQYSDLYSTGTYWDSGGPATAAFDVANIGRFSGSRGLSLATASTASAGLVKSSASNDTTHHINVAYYQTLAISGTTKTFLVTLFDGATAQCSVSFRSDGAILLYSGAASSTTVLATYSSAVTATSTWYSFEIEVVINNTTGSFKVRKNGNTSDDSSTTSLNTRASANNYANKIQVYNAGGNSANVVIDDFLWRSDSSVAWAGDVRCYTRLPAADAAVQFTRSGSTVPVTPYAVGGTVSASNGTARYCPFTASCDGTIATAILSLNVGFTGNMKCTLFNDTGSTAPGTILASATTVNNPVAGNNTFTFSSPPSVTRGTKYWIGFDTDTSVVSCYNSTVSLGGGTHYSNSANSSVTAYASFPVATPVVATGTQPMIFTANITPTTASNANLVADTAGDSSGYVYDSTVNDVDLYTLQAAAATPSSVIGVVTRGLFQKTDSGTRNVGIQLKSNITTSNGTSTALNTTIGWIYRTDTVDPDTSAAWTATGVNNLQIGAKVTA